MATKFTHEENLPSVRVTKDLLEELQRLLIQKVVSTCGVEEDKAAEEFEITVEDRLGTEHFKSVEQFSSDRFSDTTSRVKLAIASPYRAENRLVVRISFSEGRLFSSLTVEVSASNARDLALGLKEAVVRVLEPNKTWNWLFHPTSNVWGAGIATFMALLIFTNQSPKAISINWSLASFAVAVMMLVYAMGLRNTRPYSSFDSGASERRDKLWGWLISGLLTFLVFGTLFTFARRAMLGF